MMAEVPELRRTSCLVTVQAVLNLREDTSLDSSAKLIQLLKTDSYTGAQTEGNNVKT